MKKTVLLSLLAAAIPFVVGGCASRRITFKPADAKASSPSVRSTFRITSRPPTPRRATCWRPARSTRWPTPPAVLAISRIVNNTGQQIDTDLLTKKIRVALLNSGKAQTTTTMGLGGTAEDPMAKGLQQENEFMNRPEDHPQTGLHPFRQDHSNHRAGWQHQPVHLQLPTLADRHQDRPGRLGRRKGNHQTGRTPVRRLLMAIGICFSAGWEHPDRRFYLAGR